MADTAAGGVVSPHAEVDEQAPGNAPHDAARDGHGTVPDPLDDGAHAQGTRRCSDTPDEAEDAPIGHDPAEHLEPDAVLQVCRELEDHGHRALQLTLRLVAHEEVERHRRVAQHEVGDLSLPGDMAAVVEPGLARHLAVRVGILERGEVRRPQEALQREGTLFHRGGRVGEEQLVDLHARGIVAPGEQVLLRAFERLLDLALGEREDRGRSDVDAHPAARGQEDARDTGTHRRWISEARQAEDRGHDDGRAAEAEGEDRGPASPTGKTGVELGKLPGVHEGLHLVAVHAAPQEVHAPQGHGIARVLVQRLEPELQRRIGLRFLEVHGRQPQQRGDRPGLQLPCPAEVGGGASEVAGVEARGAQHQEVVGALAEAEHFRLEEAYDLGEPALAEQPPGIAEVPGSHRTLPVTRRSRRARRAPSGPRWPAPTRPGLPRSCRGRRPEAVRSPAIAN